MADRSSASRREAFRVWRLRRPFVAGLLVIAGGAVVLGFALTPIPRELVTAGIALGTYDPRLRVATGGTLGVVAGGALVLLGALLWRSPGHRLALGVATLVIGVAAFVLTHLGGLVVGTLLALVGGAMAIGWHDEPRPAASGRDRPPPDPDPDHRQMATSYDPGGDHP